MTEPSWPVPQPVPAPVPSPAQETRWDRPMSAGMPYHLLARNDRNRWWRPLLGSLLIVGLGLAIMFAAGVVFVIVALLAGASADDLGSIDKIADNQPLPFLAVNLAALALLTPVVMLAAWLVQRRRPGSLSSVIGRVRWGWLLTCAGIAVVAGVVAEAAYVLTLALSGERIDLFGWVGWEAFLPALIITVLVVPFQSAAEEYVFRGWVLQTFGAYIRSPWPAIVLGAAGFTALHAYTDWGMADVFIFGAVMGWLTVRTGGLEAAIALHAVNNVLTFLLASAAGQLPDALKQGAMPWQVLPHVIVQVGTYAALVVWLARRRRLEAVSRHR